MAAASDALPARRRADASSPGRWSLLASSTRAIEGSCPPLAAGEAIYREWPHGCDLCFARVMGRTLPPSRGAQSRRVAGPPGPAFVQELLSDGYPLDSGPVSMIGVQRFEGFGKLGEVTDSSAIGGERLEADSCVPVDGADGGSVGGGDAVMPWGHHGDHLLPLRRSCSSAPLHPRTGGVWLLRACTPRTMDVRISSSPSVDPSLTVVRLRGFSPCSGYDSFVATPRSDWRQCALRQGCAPDRVGSSALAGRSLRSQAAIRRLVAVTLAGLRPSHQSAPPKRPADHP